MLRSIFDEVRLVNITDSGDTAHLALMQRPDLGVTFTKLHCWTLTHYDKCVFMDADTMVSIEFYFIFWGAVNVNLILFIYNTILSPTTKC